MKYDEINKDVQSRQMWIFFDEINTCNSMGLISEIFCNRTYRGKPIPDRYIFIGACNPYRILSDKNKNLELGLNLKNKKQKNLVYTVNPLPHSLLNYVIDFGELSKKDTKSYIQSMILNVLGTDQKALNMAVNVVEKCHMFIRGKSDSSSVSLRDIKYFNIFYKGFIKYYNYLKILSEKRKSIGEILILDEHLNNIKELNNDSIKRNSINLSVYISYYLRLSSKELREELCNILNEMKDFDNKKYFDYGFLHIPLEESKYILNQLDINPQRGIAKNKALTENIFCELFCLINKVPLIICGKPGNSKTLSVQLLLDNMKGKSSLNDFFKNPDYMEVMQYPFQGSTTCTSKGVLKTFEKARDFASKNKNMISLVFFDEMGLAEESPENPLKVLHAELEKEDNKVAFFGITNWILDASKMNRGIRIFVQEPDQDDLIETANEIAKSIDVNLYKDNKDLFKFLSEAYFEFRENKASKKYKDFHGNRDFYHLIRNTMKYLKNESEKGEEKDINNIRTISAIKAIERNFGGYEGSVNDFKKIFYEKSKYNNINHRYNIQENISDNLKDPNSRYLLLISNNSTSQNLVEQIIKKEKRQSVIYIGSQFKGDKSESYTEEILYKIQMQMENNVILILKGLEIIYPSLYDLFNQNFSEFNGNKYAKISFSSNQSTSLINNNFKVIVLVDKQMINYEDKPFLNRFEKHVISFENILPPNYVKEVNFIYSKIEALINYESSDEKKDIKINLREQLISCDKEVIANVIFKLINEDKNISDNKLLSNVFDIIAPTLTQDIISCMYINGFIEREKELGKIIEDSYNKSYAPNINEYLKKISKEDLRHIIYTFSHITEPIFKKKEIEENNSLFKKENTTEIAVDAIENSKKLELLIDLFYKSKKNLCIIKFEKEDLNKMNYVKNIIDSKERVESINILKYYLFIVYMKRELIKENSNNSEKTKVNNKDIIIKDQIPLKDDFNQVTIDNLNDENLKYNIFDLMSNKNNNAIDILFNIEELIQEKIYDCFNEIKFLFKNKKNNFNLNVYKRQLSEGIVKSKYLMSKLHEILSRNCSNINEMTTKILTNVNCFHNEDIELISIIKAYYEKEIFSTLTRTVYLFEKNQIFSSYILYYKEIYNKIIDSFVENMDYKFINIKNPLTIILGIQVPNTLKSLQRMKIFIKDNIIEKYTENENFLRTDLPEEMNENVARNKYEKQKEELENNTKNQINKIIELKDILSIRDTSIIEAFFNDLYIIYLSHKFTEIPDNLIKFLDILVQIYLLNIDSLNDENDFNTNYAEKIIEKHKNKVETIELDDYFADVVKVLLFLQIYSEYIYYIIEVYFEIYKFSQKGEEEFKQAFIRENFEHEKSKRCLSHFKIVNIKLFKIFESIIFTIKKILYLLYEKKDNITEYIIFIKTTISQLVQFNSEYSLYSKEIYTLKSLVEVMKYLEKSDKKFNNQDLIQISKLLDNERDYINKNLEEDLANNLVEIKNIFSKHLNEKSDEYSSLFINILLNEYRIYQNDEHRKKIVKMICSNNNLIKKSTPLLEFIFSEIEPEEEVEENNEENDDNNNENNSLIQIFMKEEDEKNQNHIYNLIDEEGNNTFYHILLFFFECKIENYFFKLSKKFSEDRNNYLDKILNSSAFIYFKKCLLTYIKLSNNKIASENAYTNLLKIYSIAYIKRYLTHYIDLKLDDEILSDGLLIDMDLNFENNDQNQPNEIKLAKIYMIKLIIQKGKDIHQFRFEEKYLGFLQNFMENFNKNELNLKEKDNKEIDYYIFNLRQNYMDLDIEKQVIEVKNNEQKLINLVDNFYTLLANQYMPKYLKEQNAFNIDESNQILLKTIKENNSNISPGILLFYENLLSVDFYNKLKSKLPKNYEFNEGKIDIILYILKFILISINSPKRNLFSSLLIKEKAHKVLQESFLPGIPSSRKTNYSNQFQEVEKHLKTKSIDDGAYVCSCGIFYNVGPCGFPTQISQCPNCGEKIGGQHHRLFRREGHIRIFLNDEARKSQLNLYYADKEMPNMLLNEYQLFVDNLDKNKFKEKEQKSLLINQKEFIRTDLDLSYRKINNLTFRVLNFIFYSHIFYSNIIGVLTDEEIKVLKIEGMNIFDILEKDLNILQLLIKDNNNIKNIKEFMNILYYALEKKIEESGEIFETKEKRESFEKEINQIIDSTIINNEGDISKKLKLNYQENINNLNLNKRSFKAIINQEYSPDEEEYKLHSYLKELKYFMLSNCPSFDLLYQNFQNIKDGYKKYPVLNKILNEKHEIELLQNIPIINEVSNAFRKYYSFNIERKEAHEKTVCSEKENLKNNIFNGDENKFTDLMQNYQNSWNKIKDIAIKYDCRGVMEVHEIKDYENEKIVFLLVDKAEFGFGMYLAAAYDNLIRIEQNFINSIINFSNDNENDLIHKNYIKQLKKSINIQDAEKKDIPKMCSEEKLNQIINSCSIRKCFSKNGIVVYNNYEGIEMNLDKIEESLCEFVLSQAKLFKSDIYFVTYRYEGFRGQNTEILINYMEKYKPQRKLNQDELSAIFHYLENQEKNQDIKQREFLFDIQKLINYIQEENYQNEYSINDIVNNMPSIIHLGDIKQFINMNNRKGKDNINLFTVNSLIDFYNLFEHLCWKKIKDNINEEYKKPLGEEEKQKIKKYFETSNPNSIINKLNLSTAIRRFISKYLSGLTQDRDKNENNLLMPELKRQDLWDYYFTDHPYFENEIDIINKQCKIIIGNAMDLYEILGGDKELLEKVKNSIKIIKYEEKPKPKEKERKKEKAKTKENEDEKAKTTEMEKNRNTRDDKKNKTKDKGKDKDKKEKKQKKENDNITQKSKKKREGA